MIVGHGIDIVHIHRFKEMSKNKLDKLANRICTDFELNEFYNDKIPHLYLAKIWASKEAIIKAIGQLSWKKIQIRNNNVGKPIVQLYNNPNRLICHLSISHDGNLLVVSVVTEIYEN